MIRNFNINADLSQLTSLIKLNIPAYFHPQEEKDFIKYLHHETQAYFVVEKDNQIIGCGGINYPKDHSIAIISWDIIHPSFHGKGIGKKLLLHRLEQIKKNGTIKKVVVRTSQLSYGFYEKAGFELEKIENNFWGEGYHLYQMQMPLLKG